MIKPNEGWEWFSTSQTNQSEETETAANRELTVLFTRTFSRDDGARVLEHLKSMTKERTLGPEVSDAALRHLEGQRNLVSYIERLIARGRT